MISLDFLEIGTSCFNTMIQACGDSEIGISIEPVEEYLKMLPNKPHVVKINAALVTPEDYTKNSGLLDLFLVDIDTIQKYQLGGFLAGCNSIGKPHEFHLNYFPDPDLWHRTEDKSGLASVNLLEKGLVSKRVVNCLTYQQLSDYYKINHVKLLKIDVEGYDCNLLNSILDYIEQSASLLPDKIIFEANTHSNELEIKNMVERLKSLGYDILRLEFDIIANRTDYSLN